MPYKCWRSDRLQEVISSVTTNGLWLQSSDGVNSLPTAALHWFACSTSARSCAPVAVPWLILFPGSTRGLDSTQELYGYKYGGLLNTVLGRGGRVNSHIVLQLLQGQKKRFFKKNIKKTHKNNNNNKNSHTQKVSLSTCISLKPNLLTQKFQLDHSSQYYDTFSSLSLKFYMLSLHEHLQFPVEKW